jgi:hypothetical protein
MENKKDVFTYLFFNKILVSFHNNPNEGQKSKYMAEILKKGKDNN